MKVLLISCLVALATAKIAFEERFNDGETWTDRWVQSKHDGKEFGELKLTSGKFYGDVEDSKGLQTSQDARFYGVSAKFGKVSNKDKPLVIQFSVKHEQSIDCGGGYLKVFGCDLEQTEMHGESPYQVMFGPDICGPGTKKVHVIFSYKGQNHLIKKDIRCKDDVFSHLYTLILSPDNTYEVLIDNEKVESGSLDEDWDFLPPKMIKDPAASKPADWEDNETIADEADVKPDDWEQPEHIADQDAVKPEDWDDEMDGEWEHPLIDNPEYKGEWKARTIPNPAYKGAWVHPEIDNPDYTPDENLYEREDMCHVGLDLWQVKSGTIFDNFLITDDVAEAKTIGEATWGAIKDGEATMKKEQDEEESKKLEEEAKSAGDDEDQDDEDETDEDETDDDMTEPDIHDEIIGADDHDEL